MFLHFSAIFGENYYNLHVQYFTCTISVITMNECFGFTSLLLIGPTSITAFVYWVSFITVWRTSVSIEFNTPASFIAFIESSLRRKFDIKIKAHVLRSEIIICIT